MTRGRDEFRYARDSWTGLCEFVKIRHHRRARGGHDVDLAGIERQDDATSGPAMLVFFENDTAGCVTECGRALNDVFHGLDVRKLRSHDPCKYASIAIGTLEMTANLPPIRNLMPIFTSVGKTTRQTARLTSLRILPESYTSFGTLIEGKMSP